MFREMRRKKQQLSEADAIDILERGTSGVLALSGDDGYPYAVPISYVYSDGKLYFHSARTGHKIDSVSRCGKASFCVIDKDEIVSNEYTTYFRSVIAFGQIRLMEDQAQKRSALEMFAAKYSPEDEAGRLSVIDRQFGALCMLELTIEHMTGKEAVELAKARQNGAL